MSFQNKRITTSDITGSALAEHLVLGELLSGTVDGVNDTFTTAANVVGTSIDVYRNGLLQQQGVDYTFASGGNEVVFASPPNEDDVLLADYIK